MPASNIQDIIGNFVDGQVVTANTMPYALNPKLENIRSVVNDHATRIDTLTSQVSGLGGLLYNVVTYGADPTGVTDSTTAIQNTINAAIAQQGIVVFSNGIYKISNELTVAGTCYITSDGAGQGVTIYQTAGTKAVFTITSSYVRITDLKLDMRSSTMAGASAIQANSPSISTLYGIFVQRCQIYTTVPSTPINGIYYRKVVGGAITDCSIIGEATYTSLGIQLIDVTNVLVSRNTLSVLQQAITMTYGASAVATANQNVIIEQNVVGNIKTNMFSISYTTSIFIEKNTMSTLTGTATVYSCISFATCAQVNIYDNIFNHSVSAIAYYHRGLLFASTSYIIIARNYFLYGGYSIEATTTISYAQILNNYILEPNHLAIYLGVSKSCVVSGNTITDCWSNTLSTVALQIISGTACTVTGNILTTGTKSATYVNSKFLRTPAAFVSVLLDGNDFSAATTPAIDTSYFNVHFVEPTGKRVYYSPTGAAPTSLSQSFSTGDKVLVATPAAGGYTGYVCTAPGAPGTWKGFGDVQP